MKRFCVALTALLSLSGTGPRTAPGQESRTTDARTFLEKLPPGSTHQHVMMPLRDGVKLATDLFFPPGKGPWPAVLLRTSYTRFDPRGRNLMGRPAAGQPAGKAPIDPATLSHVLVCQNSRGRYGSEGTLPAESFDNEIDDGYDTVEWIAKQPWCNGRVGMWGPSGHGIAAMNALWSNAPHLVAVDANVTLDNGYLYMLYANGVRRDLYGWLENRNARPAPWPKPTVRPFDLDRHRAFIAERAAKCTIAFNGDTGWYDYFSESNLDTFAALAHNGKCTLSVKPSGHGQVGGLPYPKAPWPTGETRSRTFKDWLLGDDPKTPPGSRMVYFLMGDARTPNAPGNVWKVTPQWPVPHTPTSFYLQGDGSLSSSPPQDKTASLTYEYDPRNPVPTIGGHYYAQGEKAGPLDQSPLKDRKDILRFVTEPLREPLGITGKIWVELSISSDVPDTLFTAKVVDVYPDGHQAIVRDSAFMARYAQGLNKPAPLEKGKVYTLRIDLWSTALVFNKGHRIALHVSSSNSPAYEVHPNSYEPVMSFEKSPVAHNTVHVSADRPSRLILPVIPKESFQK